MTALQKAVAGPFVVSQRGRDVPSMAGDIAEAFQALAALPGARLGIAQDFQEQPLSPIEVTQVEKRAAQVGTRHKQCRARTQPTGALDSGAEPFRSLLGPALEPRQPPESACDGRHHPSIVDVLGEP